MLRTETEASQAVRGGVLAGLAGGAALAMVFVTRALMHGEDAWMAMKGPSAPFLHARAAAPGFDLLALLLGGIGHFLISAVWGALFGAVAFGLARSATIWLGVLWGFVVWMGMSYIVLPLVRLDEMARGMPVQTAMATHMMFGLAVALAFVPFQRTRVERLEPAA
jgi:hypothetical protein